ncbi:uncharacterized protein RHIMIDRAFT_249818 [Rhizopus microsporus ATCC 52813]|uniref:Uncharacterized protein n=1 Tax=Rhizopus microsporus ATCC 52813 TaxID=1340429 RepID=A0A2G4T1M3_RHIZD|nr:uncharacterized protein RHIMIDRAFT_249818 [Rhizopus microsporus ATCC 52813]PHZ14909.1 hypothetical protein RHIMIDRAFT_249818 [Rhizopus microsporus ATCC 52813]
MDDFDVLEYVQKKKFNLHIKRRTREKSSKYDNLFEISFVVWLRAPLYQGAWVNTEKELKQMKLDSWAGSTQKKKVCLIVIDYTTLSAEPSDVLELVKSHKYLEYIAVDRLKEARKYEVYRRIDTLQSPDCMECFDCHSDALIDLFKSTHVYP